MMTKSGEVEGEVSKTFFFLHAITDRSEDINRYLNSVSISPINITQEQLKGWTGTAFDPSKLLIIKKLKFEDVFNCSIFSKRSFELTRSHKKFVNCMRISKHIFSFDPDYFHFLSDKMKTPGRIICEKLGQSIKKCSYVFNIVNQIHSSI